jgi:hypothetical protein
LPSDAVRAFVKEHNERIRIESLSQRVDVHRNLSGDERRVRSSSRVEKNEAALWQAAPQWAKGNSFLAQDSYQARRHVSDRQR